jgi:hypothetical protein
VNFPSIRIEGSIVSGELLAKLDSADTRGQRPADFGCDSQSKLKDEIVRAWTAGQAFYKAFQHKLEGVKEGNAATSETRNQWVIPLLGLLGYADLEFQAQAELVGDKPFRISHRLRSHGAFAVHIVGARESLDRKPEAGAGPRVSPHAHVQEYLNLTEHLYAVVTNGRLLRLLRDSTRFVRLSYVEFDLDRMFGEDLFADFAIFYRLLHVTRLPKTASESPDSLIEHYHQDSLVSGERIRDGLSGAVKDCILKFADGFLNHPQSEALRQLVESDPEFAAHLYQHLLRLVYRLLFLMVIEERNLVYADGADKRKRNLYYAHYSLARLRRIAEKRHLADGRHHDCWDALRSTFRLFDESAAGRPLGIEPLGGELFDSGALGPLGNASLDNETLLACLRNLSLFRNPDTGQLMRVNYAALNVEEFGSVYQGLLEFEPQVQKNGNRWAFSFAKGDERSRTGSHYTPDELVQPLIKHSLDYLIADKLAEAKRMASGEWRIVPKPFCAAFIKYANQRLSRPGGLATGPGLDQAHLSTDDQIPGRGEVRPDLATPQGSGFDSFECGGGLGKPLHGGVHPVSSQGQRQPDGGGDTTHPEQRPGHITAQELDALLANTTILGKKLLNLERSLERRQAR